MMPFLSYPLAAVLASVSAEAAPAEPLEVSSMLIQLMEEVEVPAQGAGVLTEVNVREGQLVEQGQRLAQIMDTEARLAEARAKIELAIARMNAENDINVRYARKSAEVARAEMRRAEEAVAEFPHSVSASELDKLRLTLQRAELEVEQAERDFAVAKETAQLKENDYQLAQYQVQRRRIVAPLSGVVVEVYRSQGEWVEPADVILRILRMDRLRAEGFLKAAQLRGRLQGRAVTLLVDLPGQPGATFPGKIVFVSPEIDPVNNQVRVWAEVDNRGLQLRPGMRAKMMIPAAQPAAEKEPSAPLRKTKKARNGA